MGVTEDAEMMYAGTAKEGKIDVWDFTSSLRKGADMCFGYGYKS